MLEAGRSRGVVYDIATDGDVGRRLVKVNAMTVSAIAWSQKRCVSNK
jgi:hypothetical protein